MKMLKKISVGVDFTTGSAKVKIIADGREVYARKMHRGESAGVRKLLNAMVAAAEVFQDPTMGPALLAARVEGGPGGQRETT